VKLLALARNKTSLPEILAKLFPNSHTSKQRKESRDFTENTIVLEKRKTAQVANGFKKSNPSWWM
jgi:hypothetical protein